MMRLRLCIVLRALCGVCRCEEIYQTENGPVIGEKQQGSMVRVFRSIPYAQNPPRRWEASVAPRTNWSIPLDTRNYPEKCVQAGDAGVIGAEGCLFLYVYTPKTANSEQKLPVLVFLHGGGLETGDGYNEGYYDASRLAEKYGIVVVIPQYRLGALGFLAMPYDNERKYGNFGVLDQRLALEWVQRNIEAFGGNSKEITLAGESAGAISVCYHLASSAHLFQRAIIESGSCEMQTQSLDLGILFARSFARFRIPGCNWINETTPLELVLHKCLDNAPLKYLVWPQGAEAHKLPWSPYDAAPAFPWCLTADGIELISTPLHMLQHQTTTSIPLLIGVNKNEFQFDAGFSYGDALASKYFVSILPQVFPFNSKPPPWSDDDLVYIVRHFVDISELRLKSLLPLYNDQKEFADSSVERLSALMIDAIPASPEAALRGYGGWIGPCSAIRVANLFEHVFFYNFTRAGNLPTTDHFAEIPYVFQRCLEMQGACQGAFSHQDQMLEDSLSTIIGTYWSNFIHSSDPNRNGHYNHTTLPYWPRYNQISRGVIRLDFPLSDGEPILDLHQARCDAWFKLVHVNHTS